jgi:predicted RND superfamily exporter protein
MHINNSLAAWSPKQSQSEGVANYIAIGFEPTGIDVGRVERALRAQPSVAWCFGPRSEAAMRMAGITPENLVTGADAGYVGIYCIAKPGADGAGLFNDVTRTLEEIPGARSERFALGGSAAFSAALNEVSQRRMPLILVIITIAGGALLWLVTRSGRAAAAGLGAISISLIVLLGAACWAGADIDMSLLLVPPLMISLGYSYAAHAALRRDAAWALVVCCGTAMLGVASFGATDLPSIRSFALWGTLGIAIVWACVVTLVPIPTTSRVRTEGARDRRMRLLLLRLIRRRGEGIVYAGLAVSIAGVVLAASLVVDAQPLNYLSKRERIVRDTSLLEHRLTGMLPFEVVASRGSQAARLLRETPQVRKAIDVSAFLGGIDQTFWCMANNDSLESLGGAFARWAGDASTRGERLRVQGVAPQLLEVRRQMRHVAAVSIPSMLLVAAIAAGVLGGSFRAALAGLLVNLIPVAGIVVMAIAFDWSIQMPTLMVGAIGIGAGIDDAIHVFWLRRRHTLAKTFRISLRACAGSSLIAAVCMSAFVISPFKPTAQFGLLMALILGFAAAADMVVLPALLLSTSRVPRGRGADLRTRATSDRPTPPSPAGAASHRA